VTVHIALTHCQQRGKKFRISGFVALLMIVAKVDSKSNSRARMTLGNSILCHRFSIDSCSPRPMYLFLERHILKSRSTRSEYVRTEAKQAVMMARMFGLLERGVSE
jgi:hypothetical protein